MRRLLGIALLGIALPLAAQQPPKLEPLPEPPPPPPGLALDPALEPQVTITKRGEDKVEEYRINGKLYAMKVTPPHGVPYFLIDEAGNGVMSRRDSFDSGLRVPQWVIHSF
ncbi:MAG: DUF2782 domain-containing protein [Burkholderiales bacterium]|nr:DUF2782 domain-containing protein [Burkholderiales bacterium]